MILGLPSFSASTVYDQTLTAMIAGARADLEDARNQLATTDALDYLGHRIAFLEGLRER